ncbi:hypothetical protein TNCV_1528311 [Trichonephila clavipes]|nr:hypothetical protein TNCV_1528311 [Trichonephila clavipes]
MDSRDLPIEVDEVGTDQAREEPDEIIDINYNSETLLPKRLQVRFFFKAGKEGSRCENRTVVQTLPTKSCNMIQQQNARFETRLLLRGFFGGCGTISATRYYDTLLKLKGVIREKRPGLLRSGVLLFDDTRQRQRKTTLQLLVGITVLFSHQVIFICFPGFEEESPLKTLWKQC